MSEGKTILLVEDNEQLNAINRRVLVRAGYRVLTALTLAQAWDHFNTTEPDAIVLDIMLPDGNGVDFCRKIREKPPLPSSF